MTTHARRSQVTHSTLDIFCSIFVLFLAAVALVYPHRVPDWERTAFELHLAAALFVVLRWGIRFIPDGYLSTLLQTASILGIFLYVFGKIDNLQLAIVPYWMDDVLIAWEMSLFGTESTLALDSIVNPILTEWMMFAYVIYSPLLWIIGLICRYAGGREAVDDYLKNLTLTNIVCCMGFVLFPVASPLFHMPDVYVNPLGGGFFAWWGEWMRHNLHFPGGSLPSMHCANATVMLVMLYRYKRPLYYVALPTILSLYVSTVYGRYHYVGDGVAGILSAVVVLKYSPTVFSTIQTLRGSLGRFFEPRGVPESVSE